MDLLEGLKIENAGLASAVIFSNFFWVKHCLELSRRVLQKFEYLEDYVSSLQISRNT